MTESVLRIEDRDQYLSGPWVVDDLGRESFLKSNHRYGIGSQNYPTYRLAKVEGDGVESFAVANLMAHAPALLTGCELALAVMSRCGLSDSPEAVLIGDIVNSVKKG
jgi:hypothetical protein